MSTPHSPPPDSSDHSSSTVLDAGISESAESSSPSRDVVFDVLSCRRRRDVVHCLRRSDDPLTLRELSERIAAWENDVPVEAVTYKERMRVYTALKQSHLPKMDDAGVIEYDDARGASQLTEATATVEYYLDVVPKNDIPWSQYYLGLGVLSMTFVVLAWLGIAPLAGLGGFGWALLVSSLLLVSALGHRYREQTIELDESATSPEHPYQ